MDLPRTLGPYDLLRRLGSGGMGTVYEASHRHLRRRAAVKVPSDAVRADPVALRRFAREAQTAADLRHPHVVRIEDAAVVDQELPYIAMEFVDGDDLHDRLQQRPVVPLPDLVALLRPVADALDYCHGLGLVHRDVKPSNILLGRRRDGSAPVLTDFGLVLVDGASPISATGDIMGTPQYLSPEQARGETARPASDLYALACVAFQCLTGTLPFRGDALSVVLAHRNATPPRPSGLDARVPAAVDAAFAEALGKDPDFRRRSFPSVRSFVDALEAAGAGARQPVAVQEQHRTMVLERTPVQPVVTLPAEPAPVARPRRPPVPAPAAPTSARRWPAWALLGVVALAGTPAAWAAGDALRFTGQEREVVPEPSDGERLAAVTKPGAVLDQAHGDLVLAGPVGHVLNCEPQPSAENDTTVVAVGCETDFPGVDGLLLRRVSSASALTDVMDSEDRPPGDCAQEVAVDSTWAGGPLACYDNTSGVAALRWGYAGTDLSWIAVRNDGDNAALWSWFTATDWSSPEGPAD